MDVKLCKDCGETKAKVEFNRSRKAADGLYHCCRACGKKRDAARMQGYREVNARRDPFNGSLKRCSQCKNDLPRLRAHWATNPSNKDGLNSRCLLCLCAKTSDLVDRLNHLWRMERNNRRTKKRGDWVDHGKAEWLDLLIAQKCRCALTGERLTVDNVSVDHIIPVAKGGTNELSNLQLLTKNVNEIKRDCKDFIGLCKRVLWWQGLKVKENPGAS